MAAGKPAARGTREQTRERLLVEAAQKDPTKFSELYERNFDRVYAYIGRRIGNRHTTEDLTSDVFHKALAHLPNFDWRGVPFAAWLLRIASNVVVDQWKRQSKKIIEDPPEASGEIDMEELEHRARLFRMVEKLPTDQRRVISMRFAEGKSIREIAQELGRTEGAVKQLQFRGLQTLREQLGEQHG